MYIDVGLLAGVLGGGGCVGDYSTFSDRRLVLLALVSTLVSTLAAINLMIRNFKQLNIALYCALPYTIRIAIGERCYGNN